MEEAKVIQTFEPTGFSYGDLIIKLIHLQQSSCYSFNYVTVMLLYPMYSVCDILYTVHKSLHLVCIAFGGYAGQVKDINQPLVGLVPVHSIGGCVLVSSNLVGFFVYIHVSLNCMDGKI